MKVVDVTEFYSERGGGVRSHLTTKGHVLCQRGHEQIVVAPGPRDEVAVIDRIGRGAQVVVRYAGPSLPYDPTYHLLARFGKVRELVGRERPDALEVHSPYLAMAGALLAPRGSFGVRTFWWHADFIDTYLRTMLAARGAPQPAADVMLAPLWRTVRALLGSCDATFVASRWQADKLAAHGVPRVEMIPFGIEKKIFHPGARRTELRRELLGGKPGAALLVAVGRFAVEKRWEVVLDAHARLAELRAGAGGAVLAIFGDGPERGAMEARVRGRDDVRFLGFVKDRARLASALASADLLVHACPFETFGLSVAEAVGCGLPVVAPDEGGAAEVVDPSCGELYPSGDAAACAEAAARLLARDPAVLAAHARGAAERIPSEEEHFTRVLAAYERLLAGKDRRAPRVSRGVK